MASSSNEWEFQGSAISWVNALIDDRDLGLDEATQEFKNVDGRRSDMIVWRNRAAKEAVLAVELKRPEVPFDDFQRDAVRKAQQVGAPYVALWNMRQLALFRTPMAPRKDLLPSDALSDTLLLPKISSVDDWMRPDIKAELRDLAHRLVLMLHDLVTAGAINNRPVDATVFVEVLTDRIRELRVLVHADFKTSLAGSRKLRNEIVEWTRKQGLEGFVDDMEQSLAAQLAYRLAGQILFYYSFRRYELSLPPLEVSGTKPVGEQLRTFWDAVRAFDYEALYEASPLDEIPLSSGTDLKIAGLVSDLSHYDWDAVPVHVLGAIFEHMIPPHERRILGQYYTPTPLADLVLALAVGGADDVVFDPGVGTGTFLYRAHDRLRRTSGRGHTEILDQLWGGDLSAFPAELAVINMCRLDLAAQSNFPRITVQDFFELQVGQALEFPPARRNPGSTAKVTISLPAARALVGNPPYVRSQQLDDLDKRYKQRLNTLAGLAGVKSTAKFDAFAYWIVHAAKFVEEGGRIGLVISGSWLNAEYGAVLQKYILDEFQPVVILMSEAEVYFPSQDVNAIVLVAERLPEDARGEPRAPMRFVTLERPIVELTGDASAADYWTRVDFLASQIETGDAGSHDGFRVTIVDSEQERQALQESPAEPRDWTKYLRMTETYREVFPF
jgi:N-6 DNA Methylase